MNRFSLVVLAALACALPSGAAVVFDAVSPYHLIRVVDERGFRVLSFDGSSETRMSLRDPLKGHFEYTEYFQMPWLWNTQMARVLMIGLGGASTQRAYQQYCPGVWVETAEIDPLVVRVARNYFQFKDAPHQQVHVSDGRVFLRRAETKYDALIVDAYVTSRYGPCIPYHLATKEFFALAYQHLGAEGVLAYNVIGSVRGWQADMVGALYETLNVVFPQVYLFPAKESDNVVLIATKARQKADLKFLRQRAAALVQSRRVNLPGFVERVQSFQADAPPNHERCPVLSDDFAPIDNLLRPRRR